MMPAATDASLYAYGVQAARIASRLRRCQQNRLAVGQWLHPSRRDMAARVLFDGNGAVGPAAAEAWLASAGFPAPPLAVFLGAAGALHGLPMADMQRMARLRALFSHAQELRHWVDARRRKLLARWLGPAASVLLRSVLDSIGRGAAPGGAPSASALESCPADELAWQGYCLLRGDGLLAGDGPFDLLPLALNAGTAAGPPALSGPVDAGASAALLGVVEREEEDMP